MRYRLVLGSIAAFSLACSLGEDTKCGDGTVEEDGECVADTEGDADTDTDADADGDADGDTDTDAEGPPVILSWDVEPGRDQVTWTVETRGDFQDVSIEMIQTGDATFECGPGKYLACGVWAEYHEGFVERDGLWTLALDVVSDPSDQVNGSSTLFDTGDELADLTIYIVAGGARSDCLADGHDPQYYDGAPCE